MSVESPPSPARPGTPLPPLEPPGRAALARAWNNQRTGLILLAVAGALLLVVTLALSERIIENGHVLGGVEIGDVDASGMSEQEAVAAVEQSAARLESTPIKVRAGATELSVDPTALGLHVDAAASVRAARRDGRSRNPVNQLAGTVLRRFRPDSVPFVVEVDPGRFDAVLDAWVAQTGKGLVDGALQFQGTQVTEVAPKSGIGIQRARTKQQVLDALGRGDSDAGTLTIGPTTPAVDEGDVHSAARLARSVLSAPVTVTVGVTPLVLTPEQVASTLRTETVKSRLVLRSDPLALRAVLGPALAPLEVPPKDASFAITGTAVSVVPAVTGKLVNLDSVGKQIARGKHAVTANVVEVNPTRTTEWAQKLNITELVSSFTTYYKPGQPRVTNIHRAADVINNTIVLPGETFSLNTALGQRTLAKGYVSAPQIGADLEDEDAVGGGVSQVSTTVYNATFFGCYQDVTHTVHALYLSRYPMGREATLNYPSIDNQWKNDSSSAVLIKAFYSSGSITVAYYGNKGGRSCRAEGPHILQTIPPETVYVDDPTLPAGTNKVTKSGETGYVVENFRIISVPGQPDKREHYVERYSATKTQINRGTGGAPAPSPAAATPAVPPG
ncbi:MAG: VanW family protein [Acidimicrobiia bacterium]